MLFRFPLNPPFQGIDSLRNYPPCRPRWTGRICIGFHKSALYTVYPYSIMKATLCDSILRIGDATSRHLARKPARADGRGRATDRFYRARRAAAGWRLATWRTDRIAALAARDRRAAAADAGAGAAIGGGRLAGLGDATLRALCRGACRRWHRFEAPAGGETALRGRCLVDGGAGASLGCLRGATGLAAGGRRASHAPPAAGGRNWPYLGRVVPSCTCRAGSPARRASPAARTCRGRACGAYPQAPRRAGEPAGGRGSATGRCEPPGTERDARARAGSGLTCIFCSCFCEFVFMLWLALHFHSLSLEVFTRGAAVSEPLAVIERRGNRSRVVTCNYAAQACGVRAGMTAPAAQALADSLVVRRRDPAAEQTSLDGLAVWAGCFTPSVSLVPPAGLLLEISTCLSLHRGLTNLLKQARNGICDMCYAASMSCAPSSHCAWLLAKAFIEKSIREQARMEQVLATLPITLLDQPQAVMEGLERVGASTLGDCLRLPRAGTARRFGQALIDEIDQT